MKIISKIEDFRHDNFMKKLINIENLKSSFTLICSFEMFHQFARVPIDHLRIYVEDCINVSDYIVSVGCGTGVYEYEISKNNQKLQNKLILVDPNPNSFTEYPKDNKYLKVNHDTVDDMVKIRPEIVNNCVLLLIWTPPTKYPYISAVDNTIGFDYKAVEILKPKSIICLYEIYKNKDTGCAGSFAMSKLLKNPELYNYKEICTTEYVFNGNTFFGNIYPKITWLALKGSRIPKMKECINLQKEATKMSNKVPTGTGEDCVIS